MSARDATGTTRRALLAAAGTAALASGAGAAAAQEEPTLRPNFDGWLEGVDGGFQDARGEDEVVVRVGTQGNGGPFAFEPANLWIDPGTTVEFRWASDGHNAVPESQPDGADWTGHEPIEDTGFSFTSTFETGGLYAYFCDPHLSLGMKGGIAVGDDVPTREVQPPDDGGGDGTAFRLPGGDFGALFLGVIWGVGGLAALSVLAGEFYQERKKRLAAAPDTEGPPTEAPGAEPVVEIDHDDYDPVGTAVLIVFFFLVVVVMWVFVYFVEFLGNGPTVIG